MVHLGLSLPFGWLVCCQGPVDSEMSTGSRQARVLTGARGGCCGQLSDGRGRVEIDSAVGPGGAEDQDDGLVQGPVPGVAAGVGGPGGAAVFGAFGAQVAEGDRVAA